MTFKEILQQFNIHFYEGEGDKHSRPGWIQIECPWCGKNSGKHHFGFNMAHNYGNCYRCGYHRTIEVVQALTNLPWDKCRELLSEMERDHGKNAPRRGRLLLPPGIGPLDIAHWNYLTGRKFDPITLVELWGIQGIGCTGRLKWRIYIPIIHHGEVVSWTTRSISSSKTHRYISAAAEQESIPHRELLFGEDYCRHTVVICEGAFDVFRIGPGAVATFGLGFTKAQLVKMSQYPTRVVCFDNEYLAQKRAERLARELEKYPGRTYNAQLSSKDPGEATEEDVQTIRTMFLDPQVQEKSVLTKIS